MIAAMEQLVLRAMTTAEFDAYRARFIPEYAEDHVRAGDWSAEQAEDLAARQIDELLPAGPGTRGCLCCRPRPLMAGRWGWSGWGWIALPSRWSYRVFSSLNVTRHFSSVIVQRPSGGFLNAQQMDEILSHPSSTLGACSA
jgi:hypothetical protein